LWAERVTVEHTAETIGIDRDRWEVSERVSRGQDVRRQTRLAQTLCGVQGQRLSHIKTADRCAAQGLEVGAASERLAEVPRERAYVKPGAGGHED
jgi:hypothetical protein